MGTHQVTCAVCEGGNLPPRHAGRRGLVKWAKRSEPILQPSAPEGWAQRAQPRRSPATPVLRAFFPTGYGLPVLPRCRPPARSRALPTGTSSRHAHRLCSWPCNTPSTPRCLRLQARRGNALAASPHVVLWRMALTGICPTELADNAWDADPETVRIGLPAPMTQDPIVIDDDRRGMTCGGAW